MSDIPFDREAERIVIGALLDRTYCALSGDMDPHYRVLREVADAGLKGKHFLDARCRVAFGAIHYLMDQGRPVSEQSVASLCAQSKSAEHHGVTREWLDGVSRDLATIVGAGWYAARIVALAEQRRVRAAGAAIARGDDPQKARALMQAVTRREARGGVAV